MKGKVKKRKLKYINLLKTVQIKQMSRNFVNASVYVKHKINFTWSMTYDIKWPSALYDVIIHKSMETVAWLRLHFFRTLNLLLNLIEIQSQQLLSIGS